MKYNMENYIGKKIRLYPGDTDAKYGIIQNVDNLGWIIKITESRSRNFVVGKEYFINHSKSLIFEFL